MVLIGRILLLGAVFLSNLPVGWAMANGPGSLTADYDFADREQSATHRGKQPETREYPQHGIESLLWTDRPSAIARPDLLSQQPNNRSLPVNEVSIRVDSEYRYITANGLPKHDTGSFPNANNPNAITKQAHSFRISANPQLSDRITPDRGFLFGVALNGVPFDPGTGETWAGDRRWRYEALTGPVDLGLDHNHAHVQPGGLYHYHGIPTGLVAGQTQRPTLIGYAADGFPIYASQGYDQAEDANSEIREIRSSYHLKTGDRPSNSPPGNYDGSFTLDYEYIANGGDLDQCNGRFGVTPEYPKGTYHYYVTEEFPFVSRCFRGIPDSSFQKQAPGGRGRPGQAGGTTDSGRRPPRPPQGGSRRGNDSGRPPFPPPGRESPLFPPF